MGRAFRVSSPSIVSEVIDGEAVILDLRSGTYFSAMGVGASIWRHLKSCPSHREILDSLASQYEIGVSAIGDAVDRFMAELVANNLVEEFVLEASTKESHRPYGSDVALAGAAFDPPALAVHTDLQDLLLLDPIHDVDSAGWPTRKP